MAGRSNAQRLRDKRVTVKVRDDSRSISSEAARANHAAQVAIGHQFGRCAFRRTIRSRTA